MQSRFMIALGIVAACGANSETARVGGEGDAGRVSDSGDGDAAGVDASVDGGDAGLVFPVNGTVTSIIELGAIPASQAATGLGWNVSATNEFEFKAAHDAGATRVRIQCSWGSVEIQRALIASICAACARPPPQPSSVAAMA
jgi:hypothetical protein